jgi:hypothetical protein
MLYRCVNNSYYANQGPCCVLCGGRYKGVPHNKSTRPMPDTTQPIEKVKLTTHPHSETGMWSVSDLKARWPTIEFELPATWPGGTETYIPDWEQS